MNYEICQVSNYQITHSKSKKVSKPIETIEKMLNSDLQFHERLAKTDLLKLAVDVDKLTQHNTSGSLELILNDICDYLNVEKCDISYTTNFSVQSGSHHVIIPKFHMLSSYQKIFWAEFKTKYGYGKEIDHDIFNKAGWFRLPNQTKEGVEGTSHIIQQGKLRDFVLKCVENTNECTFNPSQTKIPKVKTPIIPLIQVQPTVQTPIIIQLKPIQVPINQVQQSEEPITNDKYIELLFNVIGNNSKIIDWNVWFQIAGTLKTNGYSKEVFLKFSEKNDTNNTASMTWDGTKQQTMSIYNLQSIAKRVNFIGYKKWLSIYEVNLYGPMFTTGLIADYFKLLYGDKFICVDGFVYTYNGVYWKVMDNKHSLLVNFFDKTFVKDLHEYANERMSYFTAKIGGNEDEIVKKTIENINGLSHYICKLRNISERKAMIDEIINFGTDNDVKFDTNPYYFAFENKVFDLKLNTFIQPQPNQNITLSTGYSYDDDYNHSLNDETLNHILDTIFPKSDVKDYYLSILATGLCGFQLENIFIATGTGGNGKSLINSLMMKTVGSYGYKLPSSVLLSKIKDGPNPEVANMDNIRFVLTQEPCNHKKICSSTLKEITGKPILNVRKLYSNKCQITLRLTLLLEANEVPPVDEVNNATVRRIDVTPFESNAVSQEIYDKLDDKTNIMVANPFYKTDEFKDRYKQSLFNILIKKFVVFRNNDYKLQQKPKACSDKCNDYLATSDDIFGWFDGYFEKTVSIEDSVPIPIKTIGLDKVV